MVMPRSFSMSIESSTWASICRSASPAALNQAIGQGGLAMVNVRNDGKISDVLHQAKTSNKKEAEDHRKKGRVGW